MNNWSRFFVGLMVFFGVIILATVLLVLFSPLILAGTVTFIILGAIAGVIISAIGFFTFIWFLARKEPEVEETTASNDYSIDQGKEVK
jgi:uncharacterized protein (DUF2062 family)